VRHKWGSVVLVGVIVAVVLTAPRPTGFTDPHTDDPAVRGLRTWNLDAIGAPSAWELGRGKGSTVAILDSGVDMDHPDLRDRIAGGVSCIGSTGSADRCTGSPDDHNGHGTHVAGIVAAEADNGRGIAGVAPDARVLAVQVLADQCLDPGCTAEGSATDVAAGIRWSVDHGADVINLSLAPTERAVIEPDLKRAVLDAWGRGVVVVAAAGNDAPRAEFADLPVIVVTSLDRSGRLASYSHGVGEAMWALAAPGGQIGDTAESCTDGGDPAGILSTWPGQDGADEYACLAGTSMASPHVAGAAAVLMASGLSADQTVRRLLETATDLGAPGADRLYGSGALDLARAMDQTIEPSIGTARYEAASGVGPDPAVNAQNPPRPAQEELPRSFLLVLATSAAALLASLVILHKARRPPAPTDRQD
jgi:subtilisin family serine protease